MGKYIFVSFSFGAEKSIFSNGFNFFMLLCRSDDACFKRSFSSSKRVLDVFKLDFLGLADFVCCFWGAFFIFCSGFCVV